MTRTAFASSSDRLLFLSVSVDVGSQTSKERAVLAQAQIVFGREEVLLFIETGHEARGVAGRQAQHFELWCIDGHLPQLVGVGGVAGQRRVDAVVAVDDGHVGGELHHFVCRKLPKERAALKFLPQSARVRRRCASPAGERIDGRKHVQARRAPDEPATSRRRRSSVSRLPPSSAAAIQSSLPKPAPPSAQDVALFFGRARRGAGRDRRGFW